MRIILLAGAVLYSLSTQALVLDFYDIKADQSVGFVSCAEIADPSATAPPAFQIKANLPETGPISAGNGLNNYRWELLQSVDIDNDGLQDVVTVELLLTGSSALTGGFAVGDSSGIARGESLKLSVAAIHYTLASGETRTGSFKGFTALHLSEAGDLKVNGVAYQSDSGRYPLQGTSSVLTLEPLHGQAVDATIIGFSFRIQVDPLLAGEPLNEYLNPYMLIGSIAPILLLFLRKAKPEPAVVQADKSHENLTNGKSAENKERRILRPCKT